MVNVSLHQKIVETNEEYASILREYYACRYNHECQDDEYKDSEENIFADKTRTKLEQFVAQEAQLYRNSSLRYSEMLSIITGISSDISNWLKGMKGRAVMGIPEAKKRYSSEKYYLKDMIIRLDFYSKILKALSGLEQYENEQLKCGIELSADCEYDAYLLNKCILLSQVGYCKKECTKLVKELSNRVGNSTFYSGDFYYKLAELNFNLQQYTTAQPFLDIAIDMLRTEAENPLLADTRRFQVHDMLFAAYQLKALGYEFCGNYEKAIEFMTGVAPAEVVRVFKAVLPNQSFECLIYSSDVDSAVAELSEQKREAVKEQIGKAIKNNPFSSEMSQYVYDKTNQGISDRIVAHENEKLMLRIKNSAGRQNRVDKVFESNALVAEDENLINEYIHILAHCINEYGVTHMKHDKEENEQSLSADMIMLGRALMLYVSEKRSMYKSCYATTYAEAGDTWIAKNELERMTSHDDYAEYDVTTKAEIAFFYYIINSMSLIEENAFDSDDADSELIDRYLNYCYRSFDYDAIAHMRVYSFRNRIAELLQTSDLKKMAEKFRQFAEKQSSGKTAYQEFVDNVYFQNSNARLRNEYEKVKYMYQFLLCFFEQCSDKKNVQVNRTLPIFNYAFKYIHYYNATLNNIGRDQIEYVDFRDTEKAVTLISKQISCVEQQNNIISSDSCRLILLNDGQQVTEFINQFSQYDEEANRKMSFIACRTPEILTKLSKSCNSKKVTQSRKFRILDSFEVGLKEFVIFTVFFLIKDDFFNPNNIFVMTPIGTAKACRYRKSGDLDMIINCFASQSPNSSGIQKDIYTQYRIVADEAMKREKSWEVQLNRHQYRDYISCIISVTYDSYASSDIVKYRYKYSVSDEWKEARLFQADKWKENVENIYDELKYDREKVDAHSSECSYMGNHCRVVLIDGVESSEQDVTIHDTAFLDVVNAFQNISSKEYQKTLMWRGKNDSYVGWRIIYLTNDCPDSIISEIQQIMCSNGRELVVERTRNSETYVWPNPFDYKKSDEKFLFVSHISKSYSDNLVVKRELTEFFLQRGVPVWYDKDKLIRGDSWQLAVSEVIKHPNCVGFIPLITRPGFLASPSIQFELKEALDKKKSNGDFAILPIVYGFASNNEELNDIIHSQIKDGKTLASVQELIIPENGKIITYLNPNQSLKEYTEGEIRDGRNGSLLMALSELNIRLNS